MLGDRTGQDMTGQDRTGQDRTGQNVFLEGLLTECPTQYGTIFFSNNKGTSLLFNLVKC